MKKSTYLIQKLRTHFIGRVATLGLSTALFALLSVALLPLATRVLHAGDYGAYALLMSVVALVASAVDGGASLTFPSSYKTLSRRERGRIFTSVMAVGGLGGILCAIALGMTWLWYQRVCPSADISLPMVLIAAAIIPSRVATNVFINVLSVMGRSNGIAAQMVAQAIAVFVATLIALFVFYLGGISLFIGALCGQLAALLVCFIVQYRYREISTPTRKWIWRSMQATWTSGVLGIITGVRGVAENSLIVNTLGLRAAGNYNHARLYYGLLVALSNAISHNIRSKSLDEASDPQSSFSATLRVWPPIQISFTFIGVVFVFFGEEIVGAITNGRLVEASGYVPAFVIIALIQTTEQAAEATVFVSGKGASAARFRTLIMLCSVVILFPVVFLFGIPGILTLSILDQLVYRAYLRHVTRDARILRFGDGAAIAGCLTIAVAEFYVLLAAPQISTKIVFSMLTIPMISLVGRRSIKDVLQVTKRIVRSMAAR